MSHPAVGVLLFAEYMTMRTLNRLFFATTLALTTVASLAPKGAAQTDAEADRVLKAVKLRLNGANDLNAKFKYSIERTATRQSAVVKQGNIKYKRSKFRIDLDDQVVISDGRTLWNLLVAEKEVNVMEYDAAEGFSLERIFRIYDQDFRSRSEGKEVVDGVATVKISLFPKQAKAEYHRIEVWVDGSTYYPRRMRVYGKNGSLVTYDLYNLKVNSNLQDSDFTFQQAKYPGFEVIDLR